MYLKESVASGTNHQRHRPSRNLPKKSPGPICQPTHTWKKKNLAQVWPTGFRAKAPFTFGFIPNFAQGCRTWLTFDRCPAHLVPFGEAPINRLEFWKESWRIPPNNLGPIRGCLTHKTNKRLTKTHELGINPNNVGSKDTSTKWSLKTPGFLCIVWGRLMLIRSLHTGKWWI